MQDLIDKNEIFKKVCVSSRLETLGLFIGSGFSKALMIESGSNMLSWLELLKRICDSYSIDHSIFNEGATYPLIASKIIEIVSNKEEITGEEAIKQVKKRIANFVNCCPSESVKDKYNLFFNNLNPNWIVTTNYDSLIETVIGNNAYPILPNYLFFNAKNLVPIYHIHGSVLDPSSIVISNEDYARAMRPSDYRHSRLPILFKESTVLMIGYALGDLNVISALDYRNNVYTNSSGIDNCIIQLVYNANIDKEKIYLKDSVIIYEYNDMSQFFIELVDYMNKYKSQIGRQTNDVKIKQNQFICEGPQYVMSFIEDYDNYRNETIDFMNKLDISYNYVFSQYIPFLERVFSIVFDKAHQPKQFTYYNLYLELWLDLIVNLDLKKASPIYLSFLIETFGTVCPYIGNKRGESYDAYNTWMSRSKEISRNFIELLSNSLSYKYVENLHELINIYNSK